MPIGKAIDIFINEQWDLAWTFYIDTNNIESEADKNRIINWYVNWISTGHITIDDAIEDNKTWERLPVSDALEKWNCWSALWWDDQNYTYVVIKCEMLENSMVTLPSNSDALVTMNNSITDSIQERHKNLLDKYKNNMETKNNTEEVIAIDEVAEEVVVETPTEEVQEAEISAEVEEVVKTEEVVEDNNIDEKIIEAINNSEVIKWLFNAVSRLSNSINSIIDASTNDISSSTVKRKELKLEWENNSDIYSDIAQSSFWIKN